MYFYDEDQESHLATEYESCQEYARNVGAGAPDREWINTPQDAWFRNPFYLGVPGGHPEDDSLDEDFIGPNRPARYIRPDLDDEIPF